MLDVESLMGLSPDGKTLAFVRSIASNNSESVSRLWKNELVFMRLDYQNNVSTKVLNASLPDTTNAQNAWKSNIGNTTAGMCEVILSGGENLCP